VSANQRVWKKVQKKYHQKVYEFGVKKGL
jgi:hypothetical protein